MLAFTSGLKSEFFANPEVAGLTLDEAINECNLYGDFLNDDFVVTNVKKLSFQEIKEFLEHKSEKN